jgi:hypothetical protein
LGPVIVCWRFGVVPGRTVAGRGFNQEFLA